MLTHLLQSPCTIELALTTKCNHRCLHCYNSWRNKTKIKIRNVLNKDNIRLLSDIFAYNKVFHVALSGGEPCTNIPILKYAIKQFINKNISVTLNSNVTLLNDKLVKELKDEGLSVMLTSLPSHDAIDCDNITQRKNSFNNIINGIRLCVRNNIDIGVNTVVYNNTVHKLLDIGKIVYNLGVKYLCASLAIPPIYDINNKNRYLYNKNISIQLAESLLNINKLYNIEVDTVTPMYVCDLGDVYKYYKIIKKSCGGGINHCTILTNGDILACSHEETSYGNIFSDNNLLKHWHKMQTLWASGNNLNIICKQCDYIEICGGECRILTLSNLKRNDLNPNNIYNLDKLELQFDNMFTDLDNNKQMYLNKNIKIREENFGAIINLGFTDNIFIDQDGFNILTILQKQNNKFTLNCLRYENIRINNNLINFIKYLMYKNVILFS